MRRVPASRSIMQCALVVIGAACATAGRSPTPAGETCPLTASDSAFTAKGPLYRECAVDREARLIGKALEPDFDRSRLRTCVSVDLEFVVGVDGAPEIETVRAVKSTNSDFAVAVIKTLEKWKYEPALIAGAPVRQIVTVRREASSGRVPFTVAAGPPRAGTRGRLPAESTC